MRVAIVLVFLLLLGLGGAYITRPGEGLHRGVAVALMGQGKVTAPAEATGAYAFEDFYVVTRSTMRDGDSGLLQCWGVYSRFLCTGPAPAQVQPAPAGPAPA